MNAREWDSLCDGCAKCCLLKIENEAGTKVTYTDVSCKLLDSDTCRCISYVNRRAQVFGCLQLTIQSIEEYYWLPITCAYRLLHEGKELPVWHYLVSGDREMMHRLGFSVKGKVVPEDYVDPDDIAAHATDWE